MSGGHFNHVDRQLNDIAKVIERDIETNKDTDKFGRNVGLGWSRETLKYVEKLADATRALAEVLHEYDWAASCDAEEEDFIMAAKKWLKEKE